MFLTVNPPRACALPFNRHFQHYNVKQTSNFITSFIQSSKYLNINTLYNLHYRLSKYLLSISICNSAVFIFEFLEIFFWIFTNLFNFISKHSVSIFHLKICNFQFYINKNYNPIHIQISIFWRSVLLYNHSFSGCSIYHLILGLWRLLWPNT